LSDGSNLLFNATTGEPVTGMEIEKDDDSSDDLPGNFTTSISINDAVEIAKSQNPGGVIKQVEVEVEDGKVVISVKFMDGKKVVVDASGGTVVKTQNASNSEKPESYSSTSDDTKVEDSNDDVSDDSSNSTQSSDSTDTHEDDKSGSNSGSSSGSSGSGSSSDTGSSSDED
jgi:hypothetical protein